MLFRYFGGRPYTKEAFFYGMALAAMVITVFLWFLHNVVMTSDKFIYLFGSLLPSVSLLFIMILRLIPGYQKRIRQIQEARSSVGLGINTVTRGEKIHQGMYFVHYDDMEAYIEESAVSDGGQYEKSRLWVLCQKDKLFFISI